MNFTIMSRNSAAGPIYTDRIPYQMNSVPQSWKKQFNQHPHLNPSKSKVNVRSSLNKSGESFSMSNPNIDNVRASCFIGNPPKPAHHMSKGSFFDQKYLNADKQNHDMSFDLGSISSFKKFSNVTPTSFLDCEERKKTESTFLRSSVKQTCQLRFDQESSLSKDGKAIQQIKSQILALTKKVFLNQEEISKLKQKKQKDKKIQTLEQEFTQFQIQMFDICKKNTNYFSDFEDKIEKNSKHLAELRDRVLFNPEKDFQREQINKKITHCEQQIKELTEKLHYNQENSFKSSSNQISMEQTVIKNYINEHMSEVKLRLDKHAIESNEIMFKLHRVQKKIQEKNFEEISYKRDNKICGNPIVIERKQIITIKENEFAKDKTNFYNNQNTSSRQSIKETTSDSKRQIIIRQNIYYIDSQGYLLDENKYYLLNSKNQQIKLAQPMISCLKEHNMLVTPASLQYK